MSKRNKILSLALFVLMALNSSWNTEPQEGEISLATISVDASGKEIRKSINTGKVTSVHLNTRDLGLDGAGWIKVDVRKRGTGSSAGASSNGAFNVAPQPAAGTSTPESIEIVDIRTSHGLEASVPVIDCDDCLEEYFSELIVNIDSITTNQDLIDRIESVFRDTLDDKIEEEKERQEEEERLAAEERQRTCDYEGEEAIICMDDRMSDLRRLARQNCREPRGYSSRRSTRQESRTRDPGRSSRGAARGNDPAEIKYQARLEEYETCVIERDEAQDLMFVFQEEIALAADDRVHELMQLASDPHARRQFNELSRDTRDYLRDFDRGSSFRRTFNAIFSSEGEYLGRQQMISQLQMAEMELTQTQRLAQEYQRQSQQLQQRAQSAQNPQQAMFYNQQAMNLQNQAQNLQWTNFYTEQQVQSGRMYLQNQSLYYNPAMVLASRVDRDGRGGLTGDIANDLLARHRQLDTCIGPSLGLGNPSQNQAVSSMRSGCSFGQAGYSRNYAAVAGTGFSSSLIGTQGRNENINFDNLFNSNLPGYASNNPILNTGTNVPTALTGMSLFSSRI